MYFFVTPKKTEQVKGEIRLALKSGEHQHIYDFVIGILQPQECMFLFSLPFVRLLEYHVEHPKKAISQNLKEIFELFNLDIGLKTGINLMTITR